MEYQARSNLPGTTLFDITVFHEKKNTFIYFLLFSNCYNQCVKVLTVTTAVGA